MCCTGGRSGPALSNAALEHQAVECVGSRTRMLAWVGRPFRQRPAVADSNGAERLVNSRRDLVQTDASERGCAIPGFRRSFRSRRWSGLPFRGYQRVMGWMKTKSAPSTVPECVLERNDVQLLPQAAFRSSPT
jgi:hypothetical protein